jgi:DNA-binding transcriptional MocR family regulator
VISPGEPRIIGYADLANRLRKRIRAGEFRPGQRLPAEPDLIHHYAVGRDTVRRAMRVLRTEGRVDYVRGWGMVVREPRAKQEILVGPGWTIDVRMPDADEVTDYDIPEGVPAIVVAENDGPGDLYLADQYRLRIID